MGQVLFNAFLYNTEKKRRNRIAFQFPRFSVRHVYLALELHSLQLLCVKQQEQHLPSNMYSSHMPELC